MTRFTLEVECDNAAFVDDPGELARILADVAGLGRELCPDNATGFVRDINGNRVGSWSFSNERGDDVSD